MKPKEKGGWGERGGNMVNMMKPEKEKERRKERISVEMSYFTQEGSPEPKKEKKRVCNVLFASNKKESHEPCILSPSVAARLGKKLSF